MRLNSFVQLIHDKAYVFALCICNTVGIGVWFVYEEDGSGTQPVCYEVAAPLIVKCCL